MRKKMTRRDFIRSGMFAGLAAGTGCQSASSCCRSIPSWADVRIEDAVSRYRWWRGDDLVVSFVFMTDVHSFMLERPVVPDYSDSRYHVLFAQEAADRLNCDFMVDGGDHDFENLVTSKDEALRRLGVSKSFYDGYRNRPNLFCMGNHDHGPEIGGTRPVASSLFGDAFNGIAERNGFKICFGRDRSFGYYDIPGKQFRAVFVNTSDEGYEGFSVEQLRFVEKALISVPERWSIAVFGHICVMDEIGHWKRSQRGQAGLARKAEFISVLERFVRLRPNDFVGYFCGDSHFDNAFELNGVNYTISQGFGGCDEIDVPWGAWRAPLFDRNVPGTFARETLFEIVGVKPEKHVFKMFRVGAGGAIYDRQCLYANAMV